MVNDETAAAISAAGGKAYLEKGEYGSKESAFKQDTKGADLLDLIVKHPLVRACNKIRVTSTLKSGYRFTDLPKNSVKAIEALEYNARIDITFERLMWQLAQRNCYYGEIVLDGNGRLASLRTIDGKYMEHDIDKRGNLIGYWQVLEDTIAGSDKDTRKEISRARGNESVKNNLLESGAAVYFQLYEILYIADNLLDSSTFAHAELLTLREALYNIDLIEKFITWMFESNQFRTAIRVPPSMSKTDYESYMVALNNSMANPTNFLLLRGDQIQHAPLMEITEFNRLLSLLDYYRSQVLALCQVTPIQVSLTGDSNRSSSDTQYRYVNYDDIRYKQSIISNAFRFDLFPKIGLKGASLTWNPLDLKEIKDILELGQQMLGMNAKVEAVESWLIKKGLDLEQGTLEKLEVIQPNGVENGRVKLDKNSTLHNSRKPEEKQLEDMGRK